MIMATCNISHGDISTGMSGEKLLPPIMVAAMVIKADAISEGRAKNLFFELTTTPMISIPAETSISVSKSPLKGLCPER